MSIDNTFSIYFKENSLEIYEPKNSNPNYYQLKPKGKYTFPEKILKNKQDYENGCLVLNSNNRVQFLAGSYSSDLDLDCEQPN